MKNNMKVLLVQPYTFTVRGLPQPPLALMYVASGAEQAGHEVKILDRNIETNARRVIEEFKPDVVGVTALTGKMLLDGLRVSEFVKKTHPNTSVVWGGIHTSLLPEQTLAEKSIDYVVVGEGEVTFVELLEAIQGKRDPATVLGIGYKENGRIIMNERRPTIKNLDDLPLLPWHLIEPKHYLTHETLLITSRGCPHRCAFCYNRKFHYHQWRGMSPERVREEIDHVQRFHPIRRFRFDDDNFTVNRNRLFGILDFLPREIPIYFETRVDYIDRDMCRRIAEFDDPFLFLGVESGDDAVLKRMKKDATVGQIREAYSLINEFALKSSASFIIGSPGETREETAKTIALIDEIKPTRPSCCIYVPFPGAEFTDQLLREHRLTGFDNLAAWGRLTDAEFAGERQYGEMTSAELNRIYEQYWRKFVTKFITDLRLRWVVAGMVNVVKNKARLIRRKMAGDI